MSLKLIFRNAQLDAGDDFGEKSQGEIYCSVKNSSRVGIISSQRLDIVEKQYWFTVFPGIHGKDSNRLRNPFGDYFSRIFSCLHPKIHPFPAAGLFHCVFQWC